MTRFAPQSVSVSPDIDAYFNFVLRMFVAFGVTFEVPIAVLLLVRMGMTSVARLRQARPYAIVGAFVVAAILTPPDVTSQLLLALPLCLLFELGLLLAALFGTRRAEPRESESGPAAS
jgi:sec-independent protein translocase protein TatC